MFNNKTINNMDFNEVYENNHLMVSNYIQSKINDSNNAEELCNDVFMKIYKHLENYDEQLSSMSTWIMNITNNIIIDYWRKKRMDTVAIEASNGDETYNILDQKSYAAKDIERQYISGETYDYYVSQINDLNEKYREIAVMYFIDDMKMGEISKALGVSVTYVKQAIFRSRKELKSKIK